MNTTRRTLMKTGGAIGTLIALGIFPQSAALAADNKAAFDAKTLADALKALGGTAVDSKDINLVSPDIAENGAVVPVGVTSNIPGTTDIYILVEKNPNPLSASFAIGAATEPSVQTRVKMGETSKVIAVVKANGKIYTTTRETKVTLGGCGG